MVPCDVLSLSAREGNLALLDALGQVGVAQLGVLSHHLAGSSAGGAAQHAHGRHVASGFGIVFHALCQRERLHVIGRNGRHGRSEDAQVGNLDGSAVEHKLLDAACNLVQHTNDDILGVDRTMPGNVLGETSDVDGIVVLGACIDLAEIDVALALVFVEINFNHGFTVFLVKQ